MNQALREAKPDQDMILIEHLPFQTDSGIASRARIGLIVLATDFTIEHEWRKIITPLDGVALYRAASSTMHRSPPNAARHGAAHRVFDRCHPAGGELDVVAYGCTSASMAIGEEKVFERIREVRPGAEGTTPITAAFAAFRAFGARRVGVLTPYRADVNRIVATYIQARGFEVPVFGSFNEQDDSIVARITPESIRSGVRRLLDTAKVDCIFVSCTSVRLAEAARDIEAETGVPITSSNHAMAWHALRLAGVGDALPQWGRLFARPLA